MKLRINKLEKRYEAHQELSENADKLEVYSYNLVSISSINEAISRSKHQFIKNCVSDTMILFPLMRIINYLRSEPTNFYEQQDIVNFLARQLQTSSLKAQLPPLHLENYDAKSQQEFLSSIGISSSALGLFATSDLTKIILDYTSSCKVTCKLEGKEVLKERTARSAAVSGLPTDSGEQKARNLYSGSPASSSAIAIGTFVSATPII